MDFEESSLKICVEIFEDSQAVRLKELLDWCDCIRFSDGYWYKFTKKTATKEQADLVIGSNDEDGIAKYLATANIC